MPPNWSAANASFQMSDDNVTFYNLVDSQGQEFLLPVTAGTALSVDESVTQGTLWIKVRSGSSGNPVPQESDCTIKLVCI
jgi:hypothetical protein